MESIILVRILETTKIAQYFVSFFFRSAKEDHPNMGRKSESLSRAPYGQILVSPDYVIFGFFHTCEEKITLEGHSTKERKAVSSVE